MIDLISISYLKTGDHTASILSRVHEQNVYSENPMSVDQLSVKKRNLGVRATPERHYRLKRLALERGTSVQGLVDEALDLYLGPEPQKRVSDTIPPIQMLNPSEPSATDFLSALVVDRDLPAWNRGGYDGQE